MHDSGAPRREIANSYLKLEHRDRDPLARNHGRLFENWIRGGGSGPGTGAGEA